MVFICGLINILITVTKLRKFIIKSIPRSLQNAIGGGIGIFVAYIGFLNVGFVNFGSGVPAMATLNTNVLWLFVIGLVLTIVLLVCNVKGAILIGIVATAIIGIPMQVTSLGSSISFTEACQQLPPPLAPSSPAPACPPCSPMPPRSPGADYHLRLQHL